MTDREFDIHMKRINAGDKSALREIYEEYLSYVYSIAFSVLLKKEDAEDIAADIFIKLWNNSSSYKPGGGHKGYIAAMTRNLCVDLIRKRKREDVRDTRQSEDESPACEITEEFVPGFEDSSAERLDLANALKILSQQEREIINLKLYHQYTFKEISKILKEPMGTVTWRYREAINKLRRYGYE